MNLIDIRMLSKDKKWEWYDRIGVDARVITKEHKSGFPAIVIICKEKAIYLLTDILSVEEWFEEKRKEN